MRAPLVAALLLVGCYDPDVEDCSVSCASTDECAPGQACGADGYCAAPDIAGHCIVREDIALEIQIDGDGKVIVDDAHVCDSRLSPTHTCTFTVAPTSTMRLRAEAHKDGELREWTGACAGETESCVLTPVMALTRVGASFK